LASPELLEIQSELIEKVKSAALMSLKAPGPRHPIPPRHVSKNQQSRFDLVAIGLSTGGPQAIRRIMAELPADFPVPIAIVVHMPVGYTEFLAQKLDEICPLQVIEAHEGDLVIPGRAILARAGHHLCLSRTPSGKVV